MDNIIVTITDMDRSFVCDVELPTSVPITKLKSSMLDLLNSFGFQVDFDADKMILLCNRTGKQIPEEDTLYSASIWNGDYITLVEV